MGVVVIAPVDVGVVMAEGERNGVASHAERDNCHTGGRGFRRDCPCDGRM